MGTDILANFSLDFDYARNRIWFQNVPGFTPPPFSRSGMSLYRSDPQHLTIANILASGPAAKAGLKKEDEILSIAGRKADSISSREIGRLLRQPAGTAVPITYARKEKEFSTTLVLKELLP